MYILHIPQQEHDRRLGQNRDDLLRVRDTASSRRSPKRMFSVDYCFHTVDRLAFHNRETFYFINPSASHTPH